MTSNSAAEHLEAFGITGSRRGARSAQSLRRRLPLSILLLLGLFGGVFSWMAYQEVVRALRMSGIERLAGAGRQVADLLAQSSATRLADAGRLAQDAEVRRLTLEAALPMAQAPAAFVARNPLTAVWLSDDTGRAVRLLAQGTESLARPATRLATPPVSGIGPMRAQDGRVSYFTTVPIPPSESPSPVRFLSIERTLSSTQALNLIERMIGAGAALKLGNATGDVWTDLSAAVPPPPFGSAGASTTYTTAAGERRIGTAVTVPGTPWLLWVEMPERTFLEPAATLLRRMVPVAIVLTVIGTFAVYAASGRITKPLEAATVAVEAIASGDYTRRVDTSRRDEIGRLAVAFNTMAARVADSHRALEARVHERTRALDDAREELDRFFSLSLDLLCIAGTDGRFRRVNPAWEQALGWTAADLTAIPYLDLVHPDDRADTTREAAKLADGGTTFGFENRYRTKAGSYRWLSWKVAAFPGRGLLYAAARDITEQKISERALHQYGSDLATANRELESFSYSVSHDLRSPLRSIDGFAQALAEDYQDRLDDTGRGYLARIRAAAQRMGGLIDDLLSLSRVSRAELSRTAVDLTAIAADIAARLREQDSSRSVEWRIQPGLKGQGDPRLLRIALDNLLGNAWKFTSKRDGAVIEFSQETRPGEPPAFRVRDNGAGFDMAHSSKLFGAFQRLHGMQEFAGTGIGLATVQRIIHRHGGRVWAEGAVGQGATFFFTLEGV